MRYKLLASAALGLCLAAITPAQANDCGQPGAGRACYDENEVPPNVGTYLGVFRHVSGKDCPFAAGLPESFLIDDGTIKSNAWRLEGYLTGAGTFTLRHLTDGYVVSGQVIEGKARATYASGSCHADFFWKKAR